MHNKPDAQAKDTPPGQYQPDAQAKDRASLARQAGTSFFAFLLATSLATADSPFRGPVGGVADAKNLPASWGPNENLRWKVELPGRGLSCPVIANGRLYLTSTTGYRECRLHILCFDADTGKKLWERQFEATGGTACHPKTCMAAPTPVADGNKVYALFATGDLAALDAEGNLLWYRSLVGDYPNITNQVGMAASPVLYKDTLVVPMENSGDSFVAGIDTATGKNRWKTERARDINWTTPLIVTKGGKASVVFQSPKDVTALDPENGKPRWTYTAQGISPIPSPTSAGDLILLPGQPLLAIQAGDDQTTPTTVWKSSKLPPNFASPVFHKGRVYGVTGTNVTCLDAAKGDVLWQERAAGPFAASPVIADGKIYVVNEKGVATVISLDDKHEVLAKNDLDDTILATPAVAGGRIYLRSDKWLYCISSGK
jgi:outer membrane protein assembly factor BamB